jgi:hypothetical protein
MPDMITGTAGVSPVRLLHPDPEAARGDQRLADDGWSPAGRDLLSPDGVFAVELDGDGHAVPSVRGVVAVWDVSDPPQDGGLLPHEETDPRAVRRRVRALRNAHVDRDPLLLTHRGGGVVRALVEGRTRPAYEVRERERHIRVLHVDPEVAGAVLEELRAGRYLVADGHHRLAGAVAMRREGLAAQVTALLVDADETPLSLGPIHRVVLDEQGRERAPEEVVDSVLTRCRAAGAQVAVESETTAPADARPLTTVTLVSRELRWTVTWPHHPRSDVTTLVEHVLDDTPATRTRREPNTQAAVAAAHHGALTALLPAPDLDEVLSLAGRRTLLPYKATAFEPKLPSGALVRPLPGWQPESAS